MRIAPGISYRFGSRKKGGADALIMLAILLAIMAIEIAIRIAVVGLAIAWWIVRWLYFGLRAVVDRP